MIESAVKHGKCSNGLIVGNFMASFVNAQEGQVSVLTHFAVFGAVDGERLIAGGGEFGAVGVV